MGYGTPSYKYDESWQSLSWLTLSKIEKTGQSVTDGSHCPILALLPSPTFHLGPPFALN